jgi:hypothetical protein
MSKSKPEPAEPKPKLKRKRAPSRYHGARQTIPARADSEGFSVRNLYKEIEAGRGPTITYVSKRRRIIQDAHWAAWLKTRAENPPPEVTAWRPPNRKRAAAKTIEAGA